MLGHHSLEKVCEEVLHLRNRTCPLVVLNIAQHFLVACVGMYAVIAENAGLQLSVTITTTGASYLDESFCGFWCCRCCNQTAQLPHVTMRMHSKAKGKQSNRRFTKRHLCALQRTSFFRISSAARMEMSPYMLYLQTNARREYCC